MNPPMKGSSADIMFSVTTADSASIGTCGGGGGDDGVGVVTVICKTNHHNHDMSISHGRLAAKNSVVHLGQGTLNEDDLTRN